MHVRRRIKGLARLHHGRIRPNPKNWRLHPHEQRDALLGVLGELGVIDTADVFVVDAKARAALEKIPEGDSAAFEKWLKAYKGDFMLVDGHLRVEELQKHGDGTIDCLILDLDPDEANKALATKDPIGAMAGRDQQKLMDLAQTYSFASPSVQDMLATLTGAKKRMDDGAAAAIAAADAPAILPPITGPDDGPPTAAAPTANDAGPAPSTAPASTAPAAPPPKGAPVVVPESSYKEQYGVIVMCGNAQEQEAAYNDLTASGYTCKVVVT